MNQAVAIVVLWCGCIEVNYYGESGAAFLVFDCDGDLQGYVMPARAEAFCVIRNDRGGLSHYQLTVIRNHVPIVICSKHFCETFTPYDREISLRHTTKWPLWACIEQK